MKILLVGGYSDHPNEVESLSEMTEYLREVGATVDAIHLDTIVYDLAPGSFTATSSMTDQPLNGYDTIYIRGPRMRALSTDAYYLSRFCVLNSIRCVNDYSLYYPGTKLAQAMLFYEHGMPFLRTIYTRSARELTHYAQQKLGLPFIMKTNVGSHGDSNYLLRSSEDIERAVADEPDTDFLAQEFCQNDRDYRILTAKESELIFARRGQPDTHVNNTSKGGEAEIASAGEVPDKIIRQAHSIARALNLEIAGVDVVPRLNTGDFYFLEVNSQPQLRTGAFLSEKKALVRSLLGLGD